jgi:hypothetical protein
MARICVVEGVVGPLNKALHPPGGAPASDDLMMGPMYVFRRNPTSRGGGVLRGGVAVVDAGRGVGGRSGLLR